MPRQRKQTSDATIDTDDQQLIEQPIYPLKSFSDYEQFRNDPTNSYNIFTITYKDLPDWVVDNKWIYGGYRRETGCWTGCFLSLFYWHNETGNVYTHLLGALFFIVVAPICLIEWMQIPTTQWGDRLSLMAYFAGAVICLGLSTMFHLCTCHSRHVSGWLNKADYAGIIALQLGSFVAPVYYGFFCHPGWQAVYLYPLCGLGLLILSITVSPRFASPQYRYLRTGLFTAFGIMGIIPAGHHIAIYGYTMAKSTFAIDYVLIMGGLYLIGAFIYAYRIPERWFPGKVDLVGHSHQIWHILVFAAALVHGIAIFKMYLWWHSNNPTCQYTDRDMIHWFNP
ncbi:hemolysin-III related-domain-containing protein [Gorgonomyces haynaldii]|nr:hemolysin-III related-domain-containing protein [Gorgonomyces haynaldii]